MKDELIRRSDVLGLLNDLINDFGDNYELYSTLFDSVDEMEAVNTAELPCRIPKEPIRDELNPYECGDCPSCGSIVYFFDDDFCPKCGQALDWKVDDEKALNHRAALWKMKGEAE